MRKKFEELEKHHILKYSVLWSLSYKMDKRLSHDMFHMVVHKQRPKILKKIPPSAEQIVEDGYVIKCVF